MSDFDWLDVDGRLLRLLVAVHEAGSVTGAAQRLGVTQSAVSHMLDKLRHIVHDPLFVKSGRGVVATARCDALAAQARGLLHELERFATSSTFDPSRWATTVTIAANDLQRDTLLPALIQRLQTQAPRLQLRVVASDVPTLEMLRDEHCALVISPRPPEGGDIVQKRLFTDRYAVFYDATHRQPPNSLEDYLAAEHVTVLYEPRRMLDLDQHLAQAGVHRQIRVWVPGFAGVPAFIRGSDRLATAPSLLHRHLMHDLARTEVPLPCPPLPMYLIWHLRHQHDAPHRWLREQLEATVHSLQLTADVAAGVA